MSKHAYLIVANTNFKIIEICLKMIDDSRNDIYIIFDAKSRVSSEIREKLKAIPKYSKLQFEKDIKINWAGYSQIQAAINLIKAANRSEEKYEYVHFFQGSDIPIKSQDEIHSFFEKNKGCQFVQVEKNRKEMAQQKSWYRHYFCHNRYFRTNKLVKVLNFGIVLIQKIFHIRKNKDIDLYQGSALFSITGECAEYIQAAEAEIRKRFRFSLAADEVFIQTILMNSRYKEKIKNISETVSSNARLIDRTRPDGKNSPHVWRNNELDYILSRSSDFCFARKFDENIDLEIAENICGIIKDNMKASE